MRRPWQPPRHAVSLSGRGRSARTFRCQQIMSGAPTASWRPAPPGADGFHQSAGLRWLAHGPGGAREDSDVDIVLPAEDPEAFRGDCWLRDIGWDPDGAISRRVARCAIRRGLVEARPIR